MASTSTVKRIALLGGALLVLGLAACSGATNNAGTRSAAPLHTDSAPVAPAAQGAAKSAAAQAAPPLAGASSSTAVPDQAAGGATELDRKIIRNADLGIVVDDVEAKSGSLASIATGLGGYIAGSNLIRSGDLLHGTVTLRVPSSAFDQAIAQIKALGLKVQRENITSQDVTEEYADLDARVKNLEATADQLRALLAKVQEKSTQPADILTVYRELTTITGQIEQAKGRQQYLGKLSELATISVELIPQTAAAAPQPKKAAWAPITTLRDAATALAQAGEVGVEALIWLGVLVLPIALLVALVAALGFLARRRWVAARRTP